MQRFQVPRPRAITYNVGLVGAIRDVSDAPLTALQGLSGRVAVVTGGARGIGFACCSAACRGGSGGGRGRHRRASGPRGGVFDRRRAQAPRPVDVRAAASVRAVSERALADFGRLDIWVNSAGIYPTSPLLELSEEEWDAVLDVNLRGTFIGAREAARSMIAAGSRRRHRQRLVDRRLPRRRARRLPLRRLQVRGARAHAEPRRRARRTRIRVLAVAPTVTLTAGLEAQRAPLEEAGFVLDESGRGCRSAAWGYPTTSPGWWSSARATSR